jgi:hypothetical protein
LVFGTRIFGTARWFSPSFGNGTEYRFDKDCSYRHLEAAQHST